MSIVCVSCEREVETTWNHRCEAETSVVLAETQQPAPPEPPPEEALIRRLGTLSPIVKAWFAKADAATRSVERGAPDDRSSDPGPLTAAASGS